MQCTAPGAPDTYQGAEFWDFSMVDPDNRRPVDYAHRRELLGAIGSTPMAELFARPEDGAIKLAFAERTPINATPTTLVLDKEGRVAARIIGQLLDASILETLVRDALEETS